jgi:hypothetical protein
MATYSLLLLDLVTGVLLVFDHVCFTSLLFWQRLGQRHLYCYANPGGAFLAANPVLYAVLLIIIPV